MTHGEPIKGVPGFRPKKRLGQHFLLDPGVIHRIIACARFQISDLVLEIGPGQGALTLPLARSVGNVVAVEKDTRLVGLLKKKLSRAGITNVTLVNCDILQWSFNEIEIPPPARIKVIGNLPYNISSPFLEKLVENRSSVSKAILMFQLEIAERLTASPGGKAYGAMTVLIRYHAHAARLFEVPKSAFFPRPKVDSMVLELDFERPYPKCAGNATKFKEVVKGAFAHRRKTLFNSLKDFFPFLDSKVLLEGIKKCAIDPGRRAETLSMDEFVCLASSIELTRS